MTDHTPERPDQLCAGSDSAAERCVCGKNAGHAGWITCVYAPNSQPTIDDLPTSVPRWKLGLERIREVARECGYAVAVHGSTTRDLDLIAAPWTPEAVSADQLVARLCEAVPLAEHEQPKFMVANPEAKPWGRLAWSLSGIAGCEYVDLSVVPRAGEPVPLHRRTL